jgi:predicted phage terminase large subunit-like protein
LSVPVHICSYRDRGLVRDRLDFPATLNALRSFSQTWNYAVAKLIEDKANGPAVIAMLKHEINGLIAVNPEGAKQARVRAVSPQIESGNVYLPQASIAPWIDAFIEECAVFPNGPHDDQVDAMSQALLRLKKRALALGQIYSMTKRPAWAAS